MSLTVNQQQAYQLFQNFLSSENNCFILKGYAGTGKTFLLGHLMQYLKENNWNVILLAPTGRAANILRERTSFSASTIHSCLYDLDLENSSIDHKEEQQETDYHLIFNLRENNLPVNSLILIDESSMISDKLTEQEELQFGSGKLLTDLITFVNPIQSGRKIVFIGDDAQLPPVNSSRSVALDSTYLKEQFHLTTMEYQLKEVYRQKGESGILSAATILREKLDEQAFNYFPVNANEQDLLRLETKQAIQQYVSEWKKSIFITETNSLTYDYTIYVRELLGYRKEIISPGERLLVTKNTFTPGGHKLYNGDFVGVTSVSPKPEVREVSFKDKDEMITVKLIYRDIEITYRNHENGNAYKEKIKIFENLLWRKEAGLTKHERRAIIIDFQKRHLGVKRNTQEFKKLIIGDPYFNAVQVRFGYVITCHKAQGGEWDTVYADMCFSQSIQSLSYFRWSYTVITRAKKLVYFINLPIQAILVAETRFSLLRTKLELPLKSIGAEIIEEKESGYENIYWIRLKTNIYRIKLYRNKKDIITKAMYIDKGNTPPFFQLFESLIGRSLYDDTSIKT